jgi:hypothetical protein
LSEKAWAAQSPTINGELAQFILLQVVPASETLEDVFASGLSTFVEESFGEIIESGPPVAITKFLDPGSVLSSTYVVRTTANINWRVQVIGYQLSEGIQLQIISGPASMSQPRGLWRDALDFSEGIRSQKYALTAERLAEANGQPAGSGGPVADQTSSSDGPPPLAARAGQNGAAAILHAMSTLIAC